MDYALLLVMYVAAMMFAVTGLARVYLYQRMRSDWLLATTKVDAAKLRRVNLRIRMAKIMLALSVAVIVAMVVTLGFVEDPFGWPAFAGLVLFAFAGRSALRMQEPPNSPREVVLASSRG